MLTLKFIEGLKNEWNGEPKNVIVNATKLIKAKL